MAARSVRCFLRSRLSPVLACHVSRYFLTVALSIMVRSCRSCMACGPYSEDLPGKCRRARIRLRNMPETERAATGVRNVCIALSGAKTRSIPCLHSMRSARRNSMERAAGLGKRSRHRSSSPTETIRSVTSKINRGEVEKLSPCGVPAFVEKEDRTGVI